MKVVQQVPEYDADYSLWLGALHRSSQSEGGEAAVARLGCGLWRLHLPGCGVAWSCLWVHARQLAAGRCWLPGSGACHCGRTAYALWTQQQQLTVPLLLAACDASGRHTPRSPLTAAGGGAWEEGCGLLPKPGSPAGLDPTRKQKYSRSDSEG